MSGPIESVALRTSDDVSLAADIYRPDCVPRGGVIVVHGFAASRRLPAVVDQAKALAGRGFVVLAYDARGHGASAGTCTLGQLEAYDVEAAVRRLRAHVPDIVTVGASMGSVAVLEHAMRDPLLVGIVLVSTATSWRSVVTLRAAGVTVLARTRAGRGVALRWLGVRISPEWHAGGLSTERVRRIHVPVSVVHGRNDRLIRPSAAHELYAAASEPRRLELVEGMGHAFQAAAIPAVIRAVEWAFGAVSRARP